MRPVIVFAAFLAAVAALPTYDIPEPGQLAFVLNEDDFEDYLDAWLEQEEPKWVNASRSDPTPRSGNIIYLYF